jgi:hypothetical protein
VWWDATIIANNQKFTKSSKRIIIGAVKPLKTIICVQKSEIEIKKEIISTRSVPSPISKSILEGRCEQEDPNSSATTQTNPGIISQTPGCAKCFPGRNLAGV